METRKLIIETYISHLREQGTEPPSVFSFCKELKIEEKEFFTHFSSFEAVESIYWEELIDSVICAVESGAEYSSFKSRDRFLAFGYAFLERSLEVRSLMLTRFGRLKLLCNPAYLTGFKYRFKSFAETIIEHGREQNEVAARGRFSQLYPEALYLVFRSVLVYHLKDQSPAFERSDACLEKSVNFAFDVIRTQPLDSAFDLARFFIPSPSTEWGCESKK